MPNDPMGISFSPAPDNQQQQNGQRPTPVQQAIQTLSLRIPRTVGAASGAPSELLNGQGGAGLGGGNPNSAFLLEQLIRKLFGGGPGLPMPGGGPGGGPPGGGAPGGAPTPNVGFPYPVKPGPGPTPDPPAPGEPPTDYGTPPTAPPVQQPSGPSVGPPRSPGKGWI